MASKKVSFGSSKRMRHPIRPMSSKAGLQRGDVGELQRVARAEDLVERHLHLGFAVAGEDDADLQALSKQAWRAESPSSGTWRCA